MSNPVHRFSLYKHSIKTSVLRLPVLWESWVRSSLWQKAIVQGLVLTSPLWGLTRPGLAAPTPPGTIDNTATGSFIDTATDNTVDIFSNTVTVTVVEVAGISVSFNAVNEATILQANGSAGNFQEDGSINAGDVVYFDFVVTNVGNDPTEFSLPTVPSFVSAEATFSGPMQIIAADPDGGGGPTAPTDFSAAPISIVAADNNGDSTPSTSTTDLLGTTNGYIPPDGTITVRVPVVVSSSASNVGNTIRVVLGNTATNDNSTGTQNQDYPTNPSGDDVYTKDLNDGATRSSFLSETTGPPVIEKEASALGTTTLQAAYRIEGFKSVTLTNDADSSGSITEGDTVTWIIFYVNTGTGNITDLNITDSLGSPGNGLTYVPSSLAVQTGNTSVFPTVLSGGSPILNTTYDGDTIIGEATDDDVFSGTLPTLAPNEIIQVGIQATIDDRTPDTRTEQNQASAGGNRNGGAAITPVLTDNVDNTTAGLPTNVTVPANSVAQTQVGTIDPTTFDVVAVIPPSRDFGDSPATYGTNTAFHTGTSSTLVLGTVQPDTETGPSTPLDGTGDDVTGTDDEDSVSTFPTLTPTASQTYSVLVNATNTTGSDAYLVGYIDFNQDGDFGDTNEESAPVTVPSSATNPQGYLVTFTTPAGMTDGTTYARFRLSGTQSQVESPTGSATSGEVEDYALTISPIVTGTPTLLLVKRITALVDSDGNVTTYTSYRDDNNNPNFPDTTDDNDALWPGYNGGDGSNTFTVGELETNAAPGDRIEYTIYFLNTGNAPASNVQICDALDQYLRFENNTYTGASPTDGGISSPLGLQLTLGSSSPNTVYLSSINDPPDRGQLVSQGNNPTGCVKDLAGTAMTTGDNVSGVVVVKLSSLDDSGNTNTVDPDDYYGFIRFRTIVK